MSLSVEFPHITHYLLKGVQSCDPVEPRQTQLGPSPPIEVRLTKIADPHVMLRKMVDSAVSISKRHSYNRQIEELRETEYPMLRGATYIDHAGTTLPSKSLIDSFAEKMETTLLGNPHSSSPSKPSIAHEIVENTRLKVLDLFKADPEYFDIVFVANATAGVKLVADAFAGHKTGFNYYYHRDCHTSLVGVRELTEHNQCLNSDDEVERWINDGPPSHDDFEEDRPTFFAYPAQSNMNGRRLPLSWPGAVRSSTRHSSTYTLLDVAALVSTSPLDLSDHENAPDFLVLSFYKIFGFPNLGALIIRKAAAHIFDHRIYFGGGTVEMATCTVPWVAKKTSRLCDRLEDGTGATHSILALSCAIDAHMELFGGLEKVSQHTGWLAKILYDRLNLLRHGNGKAVCCIYKDAASTYGDASTQGGTVAFNICKSDGTFVSPYLVGQRAFDRDLWIRTGSVCNPGGTAHVLGLVPEDLQREHGRGLRCGTGDDVRNGVPYGIVRASFGAMSTLHDVDVFLDFMECFVERDHPPPTRAKPPDAVWREKIEAVSESRTSEDTDRIYFDPASEHGAAKKKKKKKKKSKFRRLVTGWVSPSTMY